VFAAKQDYDRAFADYNDRAIPDFSEAIRLDPKSAYGVLWHYLARTRPGAQTGTVELETNAKILKQSDWPYPIIELYLGRRPPEATLAAATKPNARCEAQFYVGEWRLLRRDRPGAKMALKVAVDTCAKTLMEYRWARADLQWLR
jgi:lipoprotein NlpI